MISNAGIALFLFGNKLSNDKIVKSDGLFQEFEIAYKQGVKVIPIGCTGYVSTRIMEKGSSIELKIIIRNKPRAY